MDIIGKKFQYKGSSDVKVVKDIKNNRVYFTDNGSVEESKLYENFDELPNQKINAETFFEPEVNLTSNFGGLLNQIEQFKNDPSAFMRSTENYNDTRAESTTLLNGQDISGLSPETIRWMKEEEEKQKRLIESKKSAVINDPWMKQFGDGVGEVKRVDANAIHEELDIANKVNSGEISLNEINNVKATPSNNQNGLTLPKMKKTLKVKLNLEINEMIPKVEDIRAVENLFEVSLIEDIAKEICDKYINDRELLENMILSELEKIVNKKKAKKPVVKKTTNRK
jgi:hypothetical protein